LLVSPAYAAGVTDSRVSVGTSSGVTPQNHQNEPAVAIDAHNPNFVVAGAIDQGDQQPCPRALVTKMATCTIDNGVGVSGVYFSFDRGRHWMQPTYKGLTARDCHSESPCKPHIGPIGQVPWYSESGMVDAADPAVAVGPRLVNGRFSWSNGSRIYYSNLTAGLHGRSVIRSQMAIAVSRLDNPSRARVARKSSWMRPVVISKQDPKVFSDKDQLWVDNAASSPYFGRVYDCYNNFRGQGLPLVVSTSADGGSTWHSQNVTPSDNVNGLGPSGWGISACTIRTDSHGTVYLFAERFEYSEITGAPPPKGKRPTHLPGHGVHVMLTSADGGATWSGVQKLFENTDVCEFVDPLSFHCIMDGYTGARTDLGSIPSVDIANGAPTGTDATNLIIDAWSDARAGVNHERVRVTWSSNGGGSWHRPVAISRPGDRPFFAAPAISPDGHRAYVVYEAVTSPWAGTNLHSPRPYHGGFLTAPVTVAGPMHWTTVYSGPFGDLRASFPGHHFDQERLGDYVYAAASRHYGIGVWIDARNAAVCPAIQKWRARALVAGKDVFPAPSPLTDCPAAFGNTDVWSATTSPNGHP
jgi:hypothetical protein